MNLRFVKMKKPLPPPNHGKGRGFEEGMTAPKAAGPTAGGAGGG